MCLSCVPGKLQTVILETVLYSPPRSITSAALQLNCYSDNKNVEGLGNIRKPKKGTLSHFTLRKLKLNTSLERQYSLYVRA